MLNVNVSVSTIWNVSQNTGIFPGNLYLDLCIDANNHVNID